MPDLSDIRRAYAETIAGSVGVTDAPVIEAFATVPREVFLGDGPWLVHGGYTARRTSDPAAIHADVLVSLHLEKGINNGQPSLHARSIAEAAPALGERVVHVGAGTGYYTAILAQIVGTSGHVDAFEIEPSLAARASRNLAPWPQVTVHLTSALQEPLAVADLIYVSAALTTIPVTWLDALAIGGRLVLPLMPTGGTGHMWRIQRIDDIHYSARAFSTAVFIGCVGGQDARASDLLREALMRGEPERVRWLTRGSTPEADAWFVGDGWWMSAAEPQAGRG